MKKFILILSIMFAFTVVSCNGQKKSNKTVNNKIINKEKKVMSTIHLTKSDFLEKVFNFEKNKEWKYEGDKPCIVDFYADWCGPCKSIAPVMEELAEEYKDQIYIYKVNTEEEQELAAAFNIRSIPSILFIPMEGQPQMSTGALPKASFKEAIEKVLLKK